MNILSRLIKSVRIAIVLTCLLLHGHAAAVIISGQGLITISDFNDNELERGGILDFSFDVNLDADNDFFPLKPDRSSYADNASGNLLESSFIADLMFGRLTINSASNVDLVTLQFANPDDILATPVNNNVLTEVIFQWTGNPEVFDGDSPANLIEIIEQDEDSDQIVGQFFFRFNNLNNFLVRGLILPETIIIDSDTTNEVPAPSIGMLLGMAVLILFSRGRKVEA